MRIAFVFVMCMVSFCIDAQEQRDWEQYLSEVMTAEDMASDDWQQTYDLLSELQQHPININKAKREDLEQLPFLSAQEVEGVMAYLYRYGPMKSLAELKMITDIGPDSQKLLACFVYAGEGDKAPSYTHHELTASARVPFYERKGDVKGYLGSRYRHWFRYQMQVDDRLKVGIVGAKDAGEPFLTGRNRYGYDYYSPYLELKKLGRIETLVVGNYRVSMGMGMVMNNSFGLGKIAMLQNLGRSTHTLRAHASRTDGYLQGVGATLNMGRGVKLTAFTSYTPMDATLNKDGSARTIVTSGYHRTEAEMAKKHNLHAMKTGGTLRYQAGRAHVGLNALYVHFDRRIEPDKTQLYNYYKPTGTDFLNASVDYGYRHRQLALNGETAVDQNGHLATINTISLKMDRSLSLMLLQRYYSYQYASMDARSYSEGGKVQNESGVYAGVQWQPSQTWQLTAYADYAYFPWARYRETTSTYAMDYLLLCIHAHKKWKLTARYRLKTKELSHRVRLSAEYATKAFTARTQLDGGCFSADKQEWGAMLSEHLAYNYRGWQLQAGVGYFNTESSLSKVYLYEHGPLYTYTMHQLDGEGMRYWLMLKAPVGRRLVLTAKWGATNYFDRTQISSGNQQINGSSQSDLDVQLRWRF